MYFLLIVAYANMLSSLYWLLGVHLDWATALAVAIAMVHYFYQVY